MDKWLPSVAVKSAKTTCVPQSSTGIASYRSEDDASVQGLIVYSVIVDTTGTQLAVLLYREVSLIQR